MENYANEQETIEQRNKLIAAGIITPGKPKQAEKTLEQMSPEETRQYFINRGTIKPVELVDDRATYCELPRKIRHYNLNTEEGEYHPSPIKTDVDYYRRRQVYFRMLQELLFARRNLNLIVGRKEPNDPDWYF